MRAVHHKKISNSNYIDPFSRSITKRETINDITSSIFHQWRTCIMINPYKNICSKYDSNPEIMGEITIRIKENYGYNFAYGINLNSYEISNFSKWLKALHNIKK